MNKNVINTCEVTVRIDTPTMLSRLSITSQEIIAEAIGKADPRHQTDQ